MPEGWIKLYRKSLDSQVFQSPGLWKLWSLCLLKASHKTIWVPIPGITEPIKILPGQFITGRYTLHKDYYPAGKSSGLYKSPLSLWRWLQKLENMRNLNIKTNNKYSIITIINWDSYQYEQNENEQVDEQQMNNRRTTDEQQMNTNKNVKECKRTRPEKSLSELQSRYPDQELIKKVLKAISLTRKTGVVSESILIAQMQRWEKYPIEQVEAGIKIYLEKDYAEQGKRENYLLAIIRNNQDQNQKPSEEVVKPTGSKLLDAYYKIPTPGVTPKEQAELRESIYAKQAK